MNIRAKGHTIKICLYKSKVLRTKLCCCCFHYLSAGSTKRRTSSFFVPYDARLHYSVDRGYLIIPDYPLEPYIESLDFFCHTKTERECGIVEISIRGETMSSKIEGEPE